MTTDAENIEKISKTADMMVSAHALLKEQYHRWSIMSDVLLFSSTVLLCIMAFAEQSLLKRFLGSDFNIYIGVFSFIAFVYSFIALNLDWRVKAERHKAAFEKYMELKFEGLEILDRVKQSDRSDVAGFLVKYQTATPMIISLSEKDFLKCKKHHKRKVEISKLLDEKPGTSLLMIRLKLWYRDNIRS